MKYLLSIVKQTSIGRIQYYRLLSSAVNNYNQLPTTCDTQSDVYKVLEILLMTNLELTQEFRWERMCRLEWKGYV
jgi:hypothetical protein